MSTLTAELRAQAVMISDDTLTVDLVDGRTISVPLPGIPGYCTVLVKSEITGD
jgi:hypothetical protein